VGLSILRKEEHEMQKLIIFNIIATIGISSCAKTNISGTERSWDFDHKLSFKQTEMSKKQYKIEIIPKNNTDFSRMSTFLVRHALKLCNGYGFTIEYLEGVEKYDDSISQPNLLMRSLKANVRCR
jgi:uncharacterized protein YozE (UPF0346 family)